MGRAVEDGDEVALDAMRQDGETRQDVKSSGDRLVEVKAGSSGVKEESKHAEIENGTEEDAGLTSFEFLGPAIAAGKGKENESSAPSKDTRAFENNQEGHKQSPSLSPSVLETTAGNIIRDSVDSTRPIASTVNSDVPGDTHEEVRTSNSQEPEIASLKSEEDTPVIGQANTLQSIATTLTETSNIALPPQSKEAPREINPPTNAYDDGKMLITGEEFLPPLWQSGTPVLSYYSSFHGDREVDEDEDEQKLKDNLMSVNFNNFWRGHQRDGPWRAIGASRSPPPALPPTPPPQRSGSSAPGVHFDDDGTTIEEEEQPIYFDQYAQFREGEGLRGNPLPLTNSSKEPPVTCTFGLMKGRNLSFVSQDFHWDQGMRFKESLASQTSLSVGLVFLVFTNWQPWFLGPLKDAIPQYPVQPALHLSENKTTTMLPLMDWNAAQTSFVMEHVDTVPVTQKSNENTLKIGNEKTSNTPLVVWTSKTNGLPDHKQRPIVVVLSDKDKSSGVVDKIAKHYIQSQEYAWAVSHDRWNRLRLNQTWIYLDLGFLFTRWEKVWGAVKHNLNTKINEVHGSRRVVSILDQTRQLHIDNNVMISLREHLRIHKASLKVVIQRSKNPNQRGEHQETDPLTTRLDDALQLLEYYEVTATSLLEQQQNLLSLAFNLETVIQSQAVSRLNALAFVFLPLSFVASVFGITTFTAPPQWYPVAAFPTLFLTVAVAWLVNKIFTSGEGSSESPSDIENHPTSPTKQAWKFWRKKQSTEQTFIQPTFSMQGVQPQVPFYKKFRSQTPKPVAPTQPPVSPGKEQRTQTGGGGTASLQNANSEAVLLPRAFRPPDTQPTSFTMLLPRANAPPGAREGSGTMYVPSAGPPPPVRIPTFSGQRYSPYAVLPSAGPPPVNTSASVTTGYISKRPPPVGNNAPTGAPLPPPRAGVIAMPAMPVNPLEVQDTRTQYRDDRTNNRVPLSMQPLPVPVHVTTDDGTSGSIVPVVNLETGQQAGFHLLLDDERAATVGPDGGVTTIMRTVSGTAAARPEDGQGLTVEEEVQNMQTPLDTIPE